MTNVASHLAYAEREDVLSLMGQRPTDAAKLERIDALTATAAEEITRELGRDYFRWPALEAEDDVVRILDGSGTDELHFHFGLIEVTTLEVRRSITSSWETVSAADYELLPRNPAPGRPYDHIRLLGAVTWSTFPSGVALVRITGVTGWSTPPRALVESNAQRARQLLYADPSYAGATLGPEEAGRPLGPDRLPDVLWRFQSDETQRYLGCSL